MDVPEVWTLDGDDDDFPDRMFLSQSLSKEIEKQSSRKGGTVQAQFRLPQHLYDRIESILRMGHPVLKTRTDFYIDSVYLRLCEFDRKGNPDGANGLLRAAFSLFKMELEVLSRNNFLQSSKRLLEMLQSSGDIKRLTRLHDDLSMVYSDALETEPRSYTEQLENLLGQTTRLLQSAKGEAAND